MIPDIIPPLGGSKTIEEVIDTHVGKLEEISWSDLSGQKMTQNSFQLPFLNLKFKSKVAGGGFFMHDSPQQTKRLASETTEQTLQEEFDMAYRCAAASAQLRSNDTQNAGHNGSGYRWNRGHTTENFFNAMIPVSPLEETQVTNLGDCDEIFYQSARNQTYHTFNAQLNEFMAFSSAMNDIIRQVLDTETKLDSVKAQ